MWLLRGALELGGNGWVGEWQWLGLATGTIN
jgi:hypothetical protein